MHVLAFLVATSACNPNNPCNLSSDWLPAPIEVAYMTGQGAGVGAIAGALVLAIAVSPFTSTDEAAFPWVVGGAGVGVALGATTFAAFAANGRGGDAKQVALVVFILSSLSVAIASATLALAPDPYYPVPASIVLASGGALTIVAAGVMQALTQRQQQ